MRIFVLGDWLWNWFLKIFISLCFGNLNHSYGNIQSQGVGLLLLCALLASYSYNYRLAHFSEISIACVSWSAVCSMLCNVLFYLDLCYNTMEIWSYEADYIWMSVVLFFCHQRYRGKWYFILTAYLAFKYNFWTIVLRDKRSFVPY